MTNSTGYTIQTTTRRRFLGIWFSRTRTIHVPSLEAAHARAIAATDAMLATAR